jgi:hypothetical protein
MIPDGSVEFARRARNGRKLCGRLTHVTIGSAMLLEAPLCGCPRSNDFFASTGMPVHVRLRIRGAGEGAGRSLEPIFWSGSPATEPHTQSESIRSRNEKNGAETRVGLIAAAFGGSCINYDALRTSQRGRPWPRARAVTQEPCAERSPRDATWSTVKFKPHSETSERTHKSGTICARPVASTTPYGDTLVGGTLTLTISRVGLREPWPLHRYDA